MEKKTIRKIIKGVIFVGTVFTFVLSLMLINKTDELNVSKEDENYQYVNNNIVNNNIPVVNETSDEVIMKPYTSEKVEIFKKFYDKDSNEQDKENSLIYYKDTYMQNSGVLYKSSEQFDVSCILEGTVISVKTDEILGNVVEVKHSNNVISTYEGLSEVLVKKDQQLKSGDLIGKSGKILLDDPIENGLLFELIKDGKYVNPENYYNKKLSEI